MKSSGSAWRDKTSKILSTLGYRSTNYDPDVWVKITIGDNVNSYYKYMLLYVDDVLHLSKDTEEDEFKFHQVYRSKEGLGTLDRYICAKIDKFQLEDGRTIFSITCVEYMCGAIKSRIIICG